MRALVHVGITLVLAAAVAALVAFSYIRSTGLKSQPKPGALETRIARAVRGLAVPGRIRTFKNPLPSTPENIEPGLKHFARYCAMCHKNDGSGDDAPLGRGLFPKPPDMRSELTQNLTDGELFYIIVNGIRFTGMPAFGTGDEDPSDADLVWQLVHFIRRLPHISETEIGEMEGLNPL